VNDIEKKAKTLEQDRVEHQDQYDINDFFEDNPATAITNNNNLGGQLPTLLPQSS
jgi:hypothetical protein